MSLYKQLYRNYQKIIENKPIILNFTNSVTQDFMANALLALGASPIMSQDKNELNDLIKLAAAININIGTLDQGFAELVLDAAKLSVQLQKPLILDPVGAGASMARTKLALNLAPDATIIRGNASEIMALNGAANSTAGVDTSFATTDAEQSAQELAIKYANTIVVSGKTDLIITANKINLNNFGEPLMTKVTGMGCVLSAVIAAFAAINNNFQEASHLAITFYTLCAEHAATMATTPAKFKNEFIDTLYAPNWEYIEQKLI